MNELFLKIVNMSISASWLVLAVLILRLVLKKAPKWVNVVLWGIVAIRLICPFSFESALSLIPSAETIPLNIGMDTTPTINSGINAINNAVNPIISQSNTPMVGASINPLQITIGIYEYIWIFGMIALALYTAISYWRLSRKVDTAVRHKDNIFQSENVSSPFVLGIIKPRIYLPFNMNEQDLEHVVSHEQAHIRRKDHWWKPLGFLLLTIHWFNPLMWLAYVLLCRDIELACDEKVIKELGNEQRADYTQALVACSVNRRMIAACPLAFGEVGVKERVKSVMNYKKPAFWIVALAITTCAIVAVCFLTNPVQHEVLPGIYSPIESSKWRVSLLIDDVTPEGATITLIQDGGFIPNRLFYGDDYNIEKFENNQWIAVEPLIDLVWASIAYTVPLDDSIVWSINWSNTYGTLEPGLYRFCKSISDHRAPGTADYEVYTVEFIIPSSESDENNGFELSFAGNTSLQNKMVLTEESPYWCIFVNNEGSNNITVEIGGHVYEVEAETYEHIFRDELWDAGTYSASFASINGMEGTATCYTYKYRLEITGRLNNAVEDTTYVILSNIENITFEQAWKASGLSSNTADYFDPAEAVFINRTR